jgi:ThiF family
VNRSAVLLTPTQRQLVDHLLQHPSAEDVCFALYRPSQGRDRFSGIVQQPIFPLEGERKVHGNASVTARFFERALGEALAADAGLVFLHSHGRGSRGWQGMSGDDIDTESIYAPRALAMTRLPLLGMTIAGDEKWSARFWERAGRGDYRRRECETVRTIGERLAVSFHPELRPAPGFRESLHRTISAWGQPVQNDLARLRIGIVGLGNVGAIVAEALARSGVQHIRLIDFDSIKLHNLDRILHATEHDVRLARSKVELLARALRRSATAARPIIEALELSVVEEDGFRAALDCDVLFSCVDRPWPRAVLNLIAYAHGIPVVDGGIRVTVEHERMASADWKAHVAAPGRRCLQCLEQYQAAFVSVERQGDLDDPSYIAGLPANSTLLANENVFAFGLGAGSLEVLHLIVMLVAPGDVSDLGSQHYNIKTGKIDIGTRDCEANCLYSNQYLTLGDQVPIDPRGAHAAASREIEERLRRRRHWRARLGRRIDSVVDLLGRVA